MNKLERSDIYLGKYKENIFYCQNIVKLIIVITGLKTNKFS